MNVFRIVLSSLLISSHFVSSADDHGIYYDEFKALKKALPTKSIFTTYPSEEEAIFGEFADTRLGGIQQDILTCKSLSLFQTILAYIPVTVPMSSYRNNFNLDLFIVTSETMPNLYTYVDRVCKKVGITTPTIFIARKKPNYDIVSNKIFMFQGMVIIGQDLLHDLSDDALEAAITREVGSIKHNQFNKIVLATVVCYMLLEVMQLKSMLFKRLSPTNFLDEDAAQKLNKLGCTLSSLTEIIQKSVAVLVPVFALSKFFGKQSDKFACTVGQSNGLISYCDWLEQRNQSENVEFINTHALLQKNRSAMSMVWYTTLTCRYYAAKVNSFVVQLVDKICSTTPQARIAAAKKYMSQEA